jgi:hypothetical protein
MLASWGITGPVRDLAGRYPMTQGNTPTWVWDNERGWVLSFDDGSTEYLSYSGAVVSGPPTTLSLWFCSNDLTVDQTLITVCGSANDHELGMELRGTAGGDPIRGRVWNGSVFGSSDTTTGATVNTWHHACFVAASAASRTVYIDGGSSSTNTNNSAVTVNTTAVAGKLISTPEDYFSGLIDDVRIYNYAMNAGEVRALWAPETRRELYRLPRRVWMLHVAAAVPEVFPPVPGRVHRERRSPLLRM